MKTTAKTLFLTALTLSTVVFAADEPITSAASSELRIVSAMLPFEQLDSDDPEFWDKFRDAVTKDKPAPAEPPKVVERKPAEPPKEAEKPRVIERHAVAMAINNSKKPLPNNQNNPSPPYQPVKPPYQNPAPPYNPGSTPPPGAK